MSRILIKIPIPPVAASRPKVTRWSTYYSKSYTAFREVLGQWLSAHLRGVTMLEGAVTIEHCTFKMKIPDSWSNKKKLAMQGRPHTQRPDKDNLEKAIKDSLSGKLYKDDCQVWRSGETIKVWDAVGGIEIELSSVPEYDYRGVAK